MLEPAMADVGAALHRKCPRCSEKSSELAAHLLGGTVLDECMACGGVWLDAKAFEALIKSRDEQATVLWGGGPHLELEAYPSPRPALETPRYLPCPDCGQLMNRKNFANTSGVIVDICTPHGVWFDRDELGRIIRFVMKGGLDEARHQELERLEHSLREKRALGMGLGAPTFGASRDDHGGLLDVLLRALRNFLSS